MSVRRSAATGPQQGLKSSRLDEVLRAGQQARGAAAAAQEVFDHPDLANLIVPEILHALYTNTDPAEACAAANRWCTMSVANGRACRSSPEAWAQLTLRIFGPEAPTRNNQSAQRNFYALCGRAAAYRSGKKDFTGPPEWDDKDDGNAMREAAYDLALQEMHQDRHVRAFVLAAIAHDPTALAFASDKLKRDRDVVLAAVKQDGRLLMYVVPPIQNGPIPNAFKSDRELLLTAVQTYGRALRWASDELKNDWKLVLAAVENDPVALASASYELTSDRKFMLAAVMLDSGARIWASDDLRDDPEIVSAASRPRR